MNNMGRATIKKKKGVTEKKKKVKILMNPECTWYLQRRITAEKTVLLKKNQNKDAEMTEDTAF